MTTSSALLRTSLVALACSLAPALSHAEPTCPAAVTDSAKKAFPTATITNCLAEKKFFEVRMQAKDKSRIELDITPSGVIEQIEEIVPISTVPVPVSNAFAARYPKSSLLRAEKQTKRDKSVTFELAFKVGATMKEATFKDDGTFVEEE